MPNRWRRPVTGTKSDVQIQSPTFVLRIPNQTRLAEARSLNDLLVRLGRLRPYLGLHGHCRPSTPKRLLGVVTHNVQTDSRNVTPRRGRPHVGRLVEAKVPPQPL